MLQMVRYAAVDQYTKYCIVRFCVFVLGVVTPCTPLYIVQLTTDKQGRTAIVVTLITISRCGMQVTPQSRRENALRFDSQTIYRL